MTTSDLSWTKTKDALVLGIGALLVTILGLILRSQSESSATLAEVKRDVAVLIAERSRDREEVMDLKQRVRAIEETMPRVGRDR